MDFTDYIDIKDLLGLVIIISLSFFIGIVLGVKWGIMDERKNIIKLGLATYTNDVNGNSIIVYKTNTNFSIK